MYIASVAFQYIYLSESSVLSPNEQPYTEEDHRSARRQAFALVGNKRLIHSNRTTYRPAEYSFDVLHHSIPPIIACQQASELFSMTSFKTWFWKASSAYIFLYCASSDSTSFNLFSWLASAPPYLLFQL